MYATILLAAALNSQAPAALAPENFSGDTVEVGYEELAQGNAKAAIETIQSSRDFDSRDPATLINLGNAYAQLGQVDKALTHYRAAVNSDMRYELELADGQWMDSRVAARKALSALQSETSQAMAE